MKNKLKFYIFFFFFCSGITLFAQQDPQFSMYMFDKMALDPAAAGNKDALEATVITRDQWTGISGSPTTNALLLQAPLNSKKIAWGLEIMNDRTGPASNTMLEGNYAYNIHLGSGKLAFGIGLQVSDYSIDWGQIDMPDKSTDLYNGGGSMSKFLPDADAGLFYNTQTFYLGASLTHLLQPKITDIAGSAADFEYHGYIITGKSFQLSENFLLNPSLVIQLAKNAPSAYSININALLVQKLWLGLSLKAGYGFTAMAAYKISDAVQLGYAYDLGVNAIGKVGGGSHELSLTFDFGSNKLVQLSPRYF